ncbi:MAG: hypothetical protein EA406_03225, partial [Rhodospirillales bacterium]
MDTPLALYTTLLGWQFYNHIWDVLAGVGIVFLPFLGALLASLVTDRMQGDAVEEAPRKSLIRVEARIWLMLFTAMVGAVPSGLTPLTAGSLSYTSPATAASPASPSTGTYGSAGFAAGPASVPVPPWWYLVISVSQGINRAVLAAMPDLQGLQEIEQLARIAYVQDPGLRLEASRFYTDCYIPAKSRLVDDNPHGIDPDQVNWLGGRHLIDTYYGDVRAASAVSGFPFDPARDLEWTSPPGHGWGKPTCRQWWTGAGADPGHGGLRKLLLDEIHTTAPGLTGKLVSILPGAVTPTFVEDHAIRAVLSQDPPSRIDTSLYDSRGTAGGVFDRLQNTAVNFGIFLSRIFVDLFTDMITLGLPIMHALILMSLFMLLPFGVIAASYNPSFLMTGAIALFSVSFWIPIWHMVEWSREQVMLSVFHDAAGNSLTNALMLLTGTAVVDTTKAMLVDLAFSTLFLGLP